uniref:Retinol dehydrogenase 11 n=1 Tax=Clastoptera arizonana TaxID=38151 RepID=A0A1B6DDS3_9HEMI
MGWLCHGKCTSKARLDGKIAVITGCNTGIGKYTALDFYRRGARVIMACRNMEKAEAARNWIVENCKNQEGLGNLVLMRLDVSSLGSVRVFSEQIMQNEQYIHLLINNAGIMMCPRTLSEDGYELQFATNHLGHFLLTMLLLPKILQSGPARIVNVSSVAHRYYSSMYFDDINMEKRYSSVYSYARSKISNILFTKELAKRLEGSSVTVYSLHPGVVDTELSRHWSSILFPGATWIYHNVFGFFQKTPEQGAQTTIYCAVDEKAGGESGLYYDDCEVAKPIAKAEDPELAKRLWDVSVEMVKLGSDNPFK